ncbi:MAG TPA: FmdB family zinc ribbon protein [Acidimicrobiales bacterium]
MPTYEYACTACGHRLEAVQKFSDDALTQCPECGGALRKVFGAIGIVLKGSGFYKTDSRSSAGRSSGSDVKETTKSESTSSDTKTDSSSKTDTSKPSSNGDSPKKESKPAAAPVS